MSEQINNNPNITVNIANLPPDFLEVDQNQLEASANRERGMADLLEGSAALRRDIFVDGALADGVTWEDSEVLRHVNRGAALTELLLIDGAPSHDEGTDNAYRDMYGLGTVDDEIQARPERELFSAAAHDLVESRRGVANAEFQGLSAEETAANRETHLSQVDDVLAKAGLREAVESAVANLTGPGLEGSPTQLFDAKYGAALVVLGTAITKSA